MSVSVLAISFGFGKALVLLTREEIREVEKVSQY